jgi:anti-sigma regulatory factor (Ser/Thr protein kinase)
MTDPNRTTGLADADFVLTDTADARTVGRFRNELSRWLRARVALDPVRHNDVLLAVNEALTNVAEFAYGDGCGAVTMKIRHCATDSTLTVDVFDHGAWRPTDPANRSNTRGRGIPLMRALADSATISALATGTKVRLQFNDCPPIGAQRYAASV